jgi:hypothetical protein
VLKLASTPGAADEVNVTFGWRLPNHLYTKENSYAARSLDQHTALIVIDLQAGTVANPTAHPTEEIVGAIR